MLHVICVAASVASVAAAALAPHYLQLLPFLGRNVNLLSLFKFIFISLYLLVAVSPCTATHDLRDPQDVSQRFTTLHSAVLRT